MNLNLTLIGQAISFAIFVYLCMKFVWPPILEALQARKEKIAAGLADAEKAVKTLKSAEHESARIIEEGRLQVRDLVNQARDEAKNIIAAAKEQSKMEANKIIEYAHQEAEAVVSQSRKELQQQFSDLVLDGVAKVVARDVNKQDHDQLLSDLAIKV